MEWTKRDLLVKDEQKIREQWCHVSTVDEREKCFVTFPIPYQNGALHLGHLYTLSKAEFYARFQRLKGKNVLFPFGFHGTGMPIVASANKLKESLLTFDGNMDSLPSNNQIKILYNMNISLEEIPKFVDPYYWLTYFPKRAVEDLTLFGACIDFSRSFVTTDINPYFDSFVKWQFDKLNQKGHLIFGKKTMIYSPQSEQACSDDDRSVGEGVGIKEWFVHYHKIEDATIIVTSETQTGHGLIMVDVNAKYSLFMMRGCRFIARDEFIRNYQYQTDDHIHIIRCISVDEMIEMGCKPSKNIKGSGFKYDGKDKIPFEYKYDEPETKVISRSGDVCVVAVKDQWFINYNNPQLNNALRIILIMN